MQNHPNMAHIWIKKYLIVVKKDVWLIYKKYTEREEAINNVMT